MRIVLVEIGIDSDIEKSLKHVRQCLADCVKKDEIPILAPLYDPMEIKGTIGATVVYGDFGISKEMRDGIEKAKKEGRPVEFRKLPEESQAHRH